MSFSNIQTFISLISLLVSSRFFYVLMGLYEVDVTQTINTSMYFFASSSAEAVELAKSIYGTNNCYVGIVSMGTPEFNSIRQVKPEDTVSGHEFTYSDLVMEE